LSGIQIDLIAPSVLTPPTARDADSSATVVEADRAGESGGCGSETIPIPPQYAGARESRGGT
jgi:hypothetical protein